MPDNTAPEASPSVYIHRRRFPAFAPEAFPYRADHVLKQECPITSDTDINRSNLRISISLGVCSIQKRHSPDTIFAGFQRQVNQIIHTQTVIQRRRKRPL